MKNGPFVINNRFIVDPSSNRIHDAVQDKDRNIEPRLMGVLVYLSRNAFMVVSRGDLIREIWNDYGGADEGLTQAISHLRKFLLDSNKELIVTVPKKGYILRGHITEVSKDTQSANVVKLKIANLLPIDGQFFHWVKHSVLFLLTGGVIYLTTVLTSSRIMSADLFSDQRSNDNYRTDKMHECSNNESSDVWKP